MKKVKGRRTKDDGQARRLAAFFLFPFSFFLTLGCSAGYHEPNDPFLGPQAAAPRGAAPSAGVAIGTPTAGPGKNTSTGGLPRLPQPQGPASPASMAAGGQQTLDGNPDLRITGTNPNALLANGQGSRSPTGVSLGGPQPTIDPGPTPLVPATVAGPPPTPPITLPSPPPAATIPVNNATPGGAAVVRSSEETLLAWLKAHGMVSSRSDWNAQDGYRFSCTVSDPLNPKVRKVYEATNAPDRTAAIQAVVDQVNQK